MYRERKRLVDRRRGSIAEVPVAIFTLFFVFCFPLINLGTVGLRYVLFLWSVERGAHAGATAPTFNVGTSVKPSAVSIAPQVVAHMASRFSGITIISTDVAIVAVNTTTKAVTRYSAKLTSPANTQSNLYFVETTAVGDIAPLASFEMPQFFGSIPGVTEPLRAKVSMRQYAESPQGLDD